MTPNTTTLPKPYNHTTTTHDTKHHNTPKTLRHHHNHTRHRTPQHSQNPTTTPQPHTTPNTTTLPKPYNTTTKHDTEHHDTLYHATPHQTTPNQNTTGTIYDHRKSHWPLHTTTTTGNSVRVFTMQPDVWTPPRTDVFMRTRLKGPGHRGNSSSSSSSTADAPTLTSPKTPVTALTFCVRLRPMELVREEIFVSYSLPGNFNAFLFYRKGGIFWILLMHSSVEGLEEYQSRLELGVWTHYCLVLTAWSYVLYINGVQILRRTTPLPLDDLELTGMLVLGQEQDSFGGGFVQEEMFLGSLTQANLWSRFLNEKEVRDIASCRKEMHGDVFSTDLDDMESQGVSEEVLTLEELCGGEVKTVLFPEPLSFPKSSEFCEKVGGVLYAPPTCLATERLYTESLRFSNQCPGSFWIGVTDEDEEGVWRRAGGKDLVATCFTLPPNGKDSENCVALRLENGEWDDRSCNNPPRCFSCEASLNKPLILRGLCFETQEMRLFEILSYKNDKPFFHGYFGVMMYATLDNQWKIVNVRENVTIATGQTEADHGYPVGRMLWKAKSNVCSFRENQDIELSLSICGASEITCTDGSCVPTSARCDGRYQCRDLSDENECSLITFPSGYRKQIPPQPLTPGNPQTISTTVTFLRFLSIQDTNYAVTVEFVLANSWSDGRLSYHNLRHDANDNLASSSERDRTWRPTVKFTNVLDGNVKVVEGGLAVERIGPPQPRHFNQVTMVSLTFTLTLQLKSNTTDTVYSGWSGVLVDFQHISGTFDCQFDLYQYPFDTQRCSVRLLFGRDISGQLRVGGAEEEERNGEQGTNVRYEGVAALSSHFVHNFSLSVNEGPNGTSLEAMFTLERRAKLLVIKLFIPSFLLLVVGYLTLYIPLQLLQARLVLSLTTKLVLYTLFSQASSSLPSTAYVKLIDIWFFFCICTLFFIILVHVVVEHLPRDVAGAGQGQGQGQGLGKGQRQGEGHNQGLELGGGQVNMGKEVKGGQTEAWQVRKEDGSATEGEVKGGQTVGWSARGHNNMNAKLEEYRGQVRSGHVESAKPFTSPRQQQGMWSGEVRDTWQEQVTTRQNKVTPQLGQVEKQGGRESQDRTAAACGGGKWRRKWVSAGVVVGVVRFVVVPAATVFFLAFYWLAIMPRQ
ncbi:hypothetical protein Pcinc_038370 [Petrolisthes cinctipes]|uniref:C-type lectin domain-containing protein n=1 Tax=Petrolisthes cinctipes TaxID=88211 RepID=A0AAE1ELN1_PETCI|nr:hypothetical protein Pcinc_038370 [Petrolisthes cinctipes]